jgi:hypothetical protein
MILAVFLAMDAAQKHADCKTARTPVSKGRHLVFTLSFLQRATKKARGLTIKIRTKKPKNFGNCESSVGSS